MCLIRRFTCKVKNHGWSGTQQRCPPTQLRTLSCVAEPNHGSKSENGTETAGTPLQCLELPRGLATAGVPKVLEGDGGFLYFGSIGGVQPCQWLPEHKKRLRYPARIEVPTHPNPTKDTKKRFGRVSCVCLCGLDRACRFLGGWECKKA